MIVLASQPMSENDMKFQLLNPSVLGLPVTGLPGTRLSIHAEEHYPGNIASVPRVSPPGP
jgi:hypothetical protein